MQRCSCGREHFRVDEQRPLKYTKVEEKNVKQCFPDLNSDIKKFGRKDSNSFSYKREVTDAYQPLKSINALKKLQRTQYHHF